MESDQLGRAGQVNRRRDGNIRELTAGQDRRDGACDEESEVFLGRPGRFRKRRCYSASPGPFGGRLGNVLVRVCVLETGDTFEV